MSFLKRVNTTVNIDSNTGFGTNASSYGGRFVNKDGHANVLKTGISFVKKISWYHTLLTIERWKFLLIIVGFYGVVNLIFAFTYYSIGTEYLKGIAVVSETEKFWEAFFFSIQTFTTVGYGHISPTGFLTSIVAAFEALVGLLSFAIATGLFYGRFSNPKAHILFSDNAIIAPYKEGKALMIRLSPYKNANLTDAQVKITLGIPLEENGHFVNKFYTLDLELDQLNLLTLSWTLVHPITEKSPLYTFSEKDFKEIKGEVMVYFKVFDDMFSNVVVKRTSYIFDEIIYGAKFLPMFSRSSNNSQTILHIDQLNNYERVIL